MRGQNSAQRRWEMNGWRDRRQKGIKREGEGYMEAIWRRYITEQFSMDSLKISF